MNDFLKFVENKIKINFNTESILIKDNSNLHKKHKFFNPKKYHLYLEVESKYLRSLTKIESQRKIMKLLAEAISSKIHAIEIVLK